MMDFGWLEDKQYSVSDDNDDEWFYESIKSYDELLMYDLQGSVTAGCFKDREVLLLSVESGVNYEIWELSFPEKIIAAKDSAGLNNKRDFKLMSGGYLKGRPSQIVSHKGLLFSSESEVNFYRVANVNTDLISHRKIIRHLDQALIDVNNTSELVSASKTDNIEAYNIETNCNRSLGLATNNTLSYLSCIDTQIVLGYQEKCHVVTIDSRTAFTCQSFDAESCGSYIGYQRSQNASEIMSLSSTGKIFTFDCRHNKAPVKTYTLPYKSDTFQISSSPDGKWWSISGYGSEVLILDSNDYTRQFIHKGHQHVDVPLHIWHPDITNLVCSADNSSTLQAWKFIM